MRRKTVVSILSVIAAGMMVFSPMTAFAAGIEEAGQTVDGSVLTLSDYVEDTETVRTRSNFLGNGSVNLTNLGNHVLAIGGTTNCHVDCDTVYCNVYLEQMDDEEYWYTYELWNHNTTNVHTLMVSETCVVEGGYWYRARGGHVAILNNAIESITTATNGIWVD